MNTMHVSVYFWMNIVDKWLKLKLDIFNEFYKYYEVVKDREYCNFIFYFLCDKQSIKKNW